MVFFFGVGFYSLLVWKTRARTALSRSPKPQVAARLTPDECNNAMWVEFDFSWDNFYCFTVLPDLSYRLKCRIHTTNYNADLHVPVRTTSDVCTKWIRFQFMAALEVSWCFSGVKRESRSSSCGFPDPLDIRQTNPPLLLPHNRSSLPQQLWPNREAIGTLAIIP